MASVRIDVEGVQDTINILRRIEPEAIKELRSDIKNDPGLNAATSSIRSQIPAVAPLSGFMSHNGRTSYRIPKVVPVFKPPRRSLRSNEASLITIVTTPPKDGIGFEIVDMAGRGQGGRSARGRSMISKLAVSPSRYVYKGFEKKEQNVEDGVKRILDKYAEKANVKLRVM
jgi:hypothetical protein